MITFYFKFNLLKIKFKIKSHASFFFEKAFTASPEDYFFFFRWCFVFFGVFFIVFLVFFYKKTVKKHQKKQ
jgi:hypothetical protein